MQVTSQAPTLEGCLFEFFEQYWSKLPEVAETARGIEVDFRGESKIKPRFRVPAADTGNDIFFNNRELFCRFASMPTPTQRRFLASLRQAMQEHDVKRVVLTVPWSASNEKRIEVVSSLFSLDFELL